MWHVCNVALLSVVSGVAAVAMLTLALVGSAKHIVPPKQVNTATIQPEWYIVSVLKYCQIAPWRELIDSLCGP